PEIKATIQPVSDVTVAVLDTGFDFTHNDLNLIPNGNPRGDSNKVYGGIDLANGDSNATDDNGHGTLIAGIIAAITDEVAGVNNGFANGVAGVSWNARIMPVKVLDENAQGDISDSAEGILHAVQTWQAARANSPAPPFIIGQDTTFFFEPFNARLVINMSYSIEIPNSLGEPQMSRDAVNFAVNNGAVLVAAAGDSGKPVDDGFSTAYPAGHSPVIAVGAVDEINQPLTTSNRPKSTVPVADQRFVVAPGVNILGTYPVVQGGYGIGHGTSVAAAQVSGIAALMWEFYPLLLNEDALVPTILETANEDIVGPLGVDELTGYGLVDALGALEGTFEPRPTNDPITVEAFTDPILHNVIHFVVLSKYRLMDPAEIPFFLDAGGNPTCINNCASFSYRMGVDTNNDGDFTDAEDLLIADPNSGTRQPLEVDFFPNEVVIGQLDDATYVGRLFFVQGPTPNCPAGQNILPPPPTGTLIIEVTAVPEDFLIDETLPKTISASTSLELTPFTNS
ncbi:MAG TPA: S8 family serine peptidase, partial [bacterium]|nr:S8 family serine peptidase [bacterium]